MQRMKIKFDLNQKIKSLIDDASNNVFKRKEFTCDGKKNPKTPIYNFFECSTEFDTWPEKPIEFTCLFV